MAEDGTVAVWALVSAHSDGLGVGLGLAAGYPYGYGYGYPYGYASYPYDAYGYGDCYLTSRRVWTPYGWRIRRVQVCD